MKPLSIRRFRVLPAMLVGFALLPLLGSCQTPSQRAFNTPEESARWPKTVDEAVGRLLSELSSARKRQLTNLKKDELITEHFGLGIYVRNYYGLRRGNMSLLRSTGQRDPDGASGVIIEALWGRLQAAKAR